MLNMILTEINRDGFSDVLVLLKCRLIFFFSIQAWRLPCWPACLLSTASTPPSSPSFLISLWEPLIKWSQVNPGQLKLDIVFFCQTGVMCLLCSLRPHSSGTFAVLSIMVGMVCLRLAPESDFSHFNSTINATVVDEEQMNQVRLGISGTLACLTAVIQVPRGSACHCLYYF